MIGLLRANVVQDVDWRKHKMSRILSVWEALADLQNKLCSQNLGKILDIAEKFSELAPIAHYPSRTAEDGVRCFFAPPSMRNRRSQFQAISMGFPPDFRRLSIHFDRFWSFSTSFSQFQSILINFTQFQSVWLSQKRRTLLTTGRWGKQHLRWWVESVGWICVFWRPRFLPQILPKPFERRALGPPDWKSGRLKNQQIAKGAGGKAPRQKTSTIVKTRQKVFRHFSTIFAQGKKRKNRQKASKSFSTLFDDFVQPAPFFRPLLGGLWKTEDPNPNPRPLTLYPSAI